MKKLSSKNKHRNNARIRRINRLKYRDSRAFRKKRSKNRVGYNELAGYLSSLGEDDKFSEEELELVAPSEFCLHNDNGIKSTLRYIQKLKRCKRFARRVPRVVINMSHVSDIDIVAICMLLSVVQELSLLSISVVGTIPEDKDCRRIFEESGFLAHMKSIGGKKFKTSNSRNLILEIGNDTTSSEELGKLIKKSISYITGREEHFEPIYTIVMELSGNSVEHAYNSRKHWLLGVNYVEDENKVVYTFTDNGYGILSTLNRRFPKKVFEGLNNRAEILDRAFDRQYGSRHDEQINRNRGLPKVKAYSKYVKNLNVITNNVNLHMDSQKRVLKESYSGTLFSWELDIEHYKKWKEK